MHYQWDVKVSDWLIEPTSGNLDTEAELKTEIIDKVPGSFPHLSSTARLRQAWTAVRAAAAALKPQLADEAALDEPMGSGELTSLLALPGFDICRRY